MSWYGWGGIFNHIFGGADYAREEFVSLNIRLCWEEYQLVTGGREATRGESFASGAGNGLGHVDKRDSHWGFDVIQAGICYGDQLAPKPDERRRVVAV